MKRFVSAFLALCIFSTLLVSSALAYDLTVEDEAYPIAQALNEAGLFSGTGTDAKGKPIFNLEGTATRAQAIVMLVRILGKEEEAAQAPASPFTDVPAWAVPHVNYAYANGLTSGTGDATFGSDNSISNAEYLTFCLRALGYGDEDFQWDKAASFARTKGLIERGEYEDRAAAFKRADVVLITYATMKATVKGGRQTLAEQQGITLKDVERGTTPYWRTPLEEFVNPELLNILDTEDQSLWIPDQYGNLHFMHYLTWCGGVFSNLKDQYDPNLSVKENLQLFCDRSNSFSSMNQFKVNEYTDDDGAPCLSIRLFDEHEADGFRRINGEPVFQYNLDTEEGWFSVWPLTSWFDSTKEGEKYESTIYHPRTWLYTNIMAFFDYDMAIRIHAIITDYYLNTDARVGTVKTGVDENGWPTYEYVRHGCGPITPEFVAQYGLTYIDGGAEDDAWRDEYVVVSNGNVTVKIAYKNSNTATNSWAMDVRVTLQMKTQHN